MPDKFDDDEELTATPYERWWWDCPACGLPNDSGDIQPEGEETCENCGETVVLR
jgi:hypothetical protein